jgi:hypothetical protein
VNTACIPARRTRARESGGTWELSDRAKRPVNTSVRCNTLSAHELAGGFLRRQGGAQAGAWLEAMPNMAIKKNYQGGNMKVMQLVLAVILSATFTGWAQTGSSNDSTPAPNSNSQTQSQSGMRQQRRQQMQQMHQQMAQDMKAEMDKMRGMVQKMRSDAANMKDSAGKSAMNTNADMWQEMLDHLQQHMDMMHNMMQEHHGMKNNGMGNMQNQSPPQ